MSAQQQPQLKHGLSNRHIQLIALGGSIGTGLFLGISQTIKLALLVILPISFGALLRALCRVGTIGCSMSWSAWRN